MKTRLQNRISRTDIAALLTFAVVWAYYIFIVRYGLCSTDESYSVTIAQRLLQGDRFLVDETSAAQFPVIFLFLPLKLFVDVTGGTEGVILFWRYLFVAFNAVFYWVMYRRLRSCGWPALIASLLFSLYVPMLLFICNYYTVPIRLLMIVCLLLFSEKQTPASLLLAGVLLACSVLYQPSFALLYFGFTVLVWVRFFRQKKRKPFLEDFAFCLHARAWKYISISVFVCAAVFLGWLLGRGGLRNVLTALPFVLKNPDLDFSAEGDMKLVFFNKIGQAIEIYGLYCLIPALAIIAASVAYARGFFRNRRGTAKKTLFCLACVVWVLSCVPTFRLFNAESSVAFFAMYPSPTLWFGIVCYLLCAHKDKRFLLFWIVSLASSLCVDISSHEALSLGSPIAYIADLIFFTDLVREFRKESEKKAKTHSIRDWRQTERKNLAVRWCTRLTCGCFALWCGFILFFDNTAFPEFRSIGTPIHMLQYVCTQGPWRSLHISQSVGEVYSERLADIDTIREKKLKSLYIYGLAPDLYVYADLPYAASTAWGSHQMSFLDQQVQYWTLHPERLPACIYVPIYESDDPETDDVFEDGVFLLQIRDTFDPLCDYTVEQGQAGYILYVSQWYLDANHEGGRS